MPLCTYVCIDLKSCYASVECVDRGLDPFSTNLVVADPSRGKGALCLAISPAMKALGYATAAAYLKFPPICATSPPYPECSIISIYPLRFMAYICR